MYTHFKDHRIFLISTSSAKAGKIPALNKNTLRVSWLIIKLKGTMKVSKRFTDQLETWEIKVMMNFKWKQHSWIWTSSSHLHFNKNTFSLRILFLNKKTPKTTRHHIPDKILRCSGHLRHVQVVFWNSTKNYCTKITESENGLCWEGP